MRNSNLNSYCAYTKEYQGCRTAMYSGYAQSEERFVELCKNAGFDLEDLDVELVHKNATNELGQPCQEGVREDLGTSWQV